MKLPNRTWLSLWNKDSLWKSNSKHDNLDASIRLLLSAPQSLPQDLTYSSVQLYTSNYRLQTQGKTNLQYRRDALSPSLPESLNICLRTWQGPLGLAGCGWLHCGQLPLWSSWGQKMDGYGSSLTPEFLHTLGEWCQHTHWVQRCRVSSSELQPFLIAQLKIQVKKHFLNSVG